MGTKKNKENLRGRQAKISFRKIKKMSPEALFLVSVGGMFEAYFEDALVFSELMARAVLREGKKARTT